MRYRGQGSLEYLFMVAAALVIVAILMTKFFNPRTGTVHKLGNTASNVEQDIDSSLNSMISSS
ncbi:class III signal peptide-containing protein [Thermococcus profundus]|uniref:class III signal peptide-containing protein n=1 Tax=Thermococcus profundus TaxID=49899 RepID=UPI0012FD7424|nr:class III signal peptide-containing protein [Thermococcus profundus]